MRALKYILALAAAVAAAWAACEFPYYPEYADAFAKVDEVTPLLAKKAVMARPLICPVGAIVCEPLIIRDVAGKPTWTYIAVYAGDGSSRVDRRNALARKLNAGERLEAAALEEDVRNGLYRFRRAWETEGTLASLVAGGAAGELTVDAVLSSAELGAPLFETGGVAPAEASVHVAAGVRVGAF